MFCRACGKQIEGDARFCRFCGAAQEEPAQAATTASQGPGAAAGRRAPGRGVVERLRDLFPRHHLQDTFMHTATIVAFVVAVIGFIFGFFPPVAYIGVDWLLFAIALLLFLMLRESTLSHLRGRNRRHDEATGGRYHAAREQQPPAAVPGEAATAQPSQPRKT